MVETCHACHGHSDNYEKTNLRRCSGCQKVYYCSTACQKENWVEHIFDCKPRRPINTADYLASAVRRSQYPEHLQTCEDYGFDRALTGEEKAHLLCLYIDLINVLKIPPKTIHDWRVRGVLVDEIKAAFYKLPEQRRGCHFSWFLQNEHIVALAGVPLSEEAVRGAARAMSVRAWRFIGGSEQDSPDEIWTAIQSKPKEERDCYFMYSFLLVRWRPHPALDIWAEFGFAACTSQEEESALAIRYQKLITMCTFKEFCDAYRTGCLLDLFQSKGQQVYEPHGHFRDLFQAQPGRKKSVWYLKQFILHEDTSSRYIAVVVDYGFINCRGDSERQELKRVYEAFFDQHGDPLALHEAAIQGNIYSYLSTVMEGLQDSKFQRLMKNMYPRPSLDL